MCSGTLPRKIRVSWALEHISLVICIPLHRKHVSPVKFVSPTQETHIPGDICFPTEETHIPSEMCSPTHETHFTSDMLFTYIMHFQSLMFKVI